MFDAAMNKRVHTRLALEQDLRSAVNRDAIEIHLQPIVDIRSGRLVSFEAWRAGTIRAMAPCRRCSSSKCRSFRPHRRARRMRLPQCRAADRRLAARGPQARARGRERLRQAAQAFELPERLVAIAHEFDIAPTRWKSSSPRASRCRIPSST
jgi:hypothetical protein